MHSLWRRRSLFFLATVPFLLLLAPSLRRQPLRAPPSFAPLSLGCTWAAAAGRGTLPSDASELAAVLSTVADWQTNATCVAGSGCHLLLRTSEPLWASKGTLTFMAAASKSTWALLPACPAAGLAAVAAKEQAGDSGRWLLRVPADGWYHFAGASSEGTAPAGFEAGEGNVARCSGPAPPPPRHVASAASAPREDVLDCFWLHSGTRRGLLREDGLRFWPRAFVSYDADTAAWLSFDAAGGPAGGSGGDVAATCRTGCHSLARSQATFLASKGTLRLRACAAVALALLPQAPGTCAIVQEMPPTGSTSCRDIAFKVPAPGWYIIAAASQHVERRTLPPVMRVEQLDFEAEGWTDSAPAMVSSCAAGGAAAAAALAAEPRPASSGALIYLVMPSNLKELRWSLATVCAAGGAWSWRHELLLAAFPEDVAVLASTLDLDSPAWRRAASCFRGGRARLLVLVDPSTAHRAGAALRVMPPEALAALDQAWAAFGAHLPRSRFSVGYRKMVWFWSFGLLSDDRLAQYGHLWRLDTDSELLRAPAEDPLAGMVTHGSVLGYHCWTYEAPHAARGFAAAAGLSARAANLLPAAWPGWPLTSEPTPADFPGGMFYNNFMLLRVSAFHFSTPGGASRAAFLAPLLPGILARRWGDALIWGALGGLLANETTAWHLSGLAYNHGRGYTQMLFPGNDERVTTSFAAWAARHPKGPRGGCTDPRVRWTHRVALKAWRAAHGEFF